MIVLGQYLRELELCLAALENKIIPRCVPLVKSDSDAYVFITRSCARYKEIHTDLLLYPM